MTEYLVRNGNGKWEICVPGVFSLPIAKGSIHHGFQLAWANRYGAFFCEAGDAIEVKELEE